jgi:putative heme-binding domain-containing protein
VTARLLFLRPILKGLTIPGFSWPAILALVLAAILAATASSGGQDSTALEVVRRLKGMDIDANPALKAAVLRVLETTRGTPEFVEIVRDFKLPGQEAGLIEVAIKHSTTSAGAEAARLSLASGNTNLISEVLRDAKPDEAAKLAQALGNSVDKRAVPLLLVVLERTNAESVLRTAAIRSLARTQEGAAELLRLAHTDKLDERARYTASLGLVNAPWPVIKEQAARLLPPPKTGDGSDLPAVAELVKLTGNPDNGAKVFRSEQAACIKCHRVGNEGIDFGPALTEIGTKLGKEALYESILDPSAGISFGYEGWQVQTRQGDELLGILTSETPDELAIKDQAGVVIRLKTGDIIERQRQNLSVMPAGLAQAMTRQELVDLVEYLTTLRRP